MDVIRKGFELYRNRPVRPSWKVPALFCNDWAALRLLRMCELLEAPMPFDVVYGAPACAWAGGRPAAVRRRLSEEEVECYFEAYRHFGVSCALTFSKMSIPSESYGDPYCNMLLDAADRHRSQVIVFDDDFARFIKRTHANVQVVASLNKAMVDYRDGFADETAYYRTMLETYDEVVIRCEYVLDGRAIRNLQDAADRVEVIVNQFCVPNCKHVRNHLRAIEQWEACGRTGECQACYSLEQAGDVGRRLASNLFMSNAMIDDLCACGFSKLKLAGRNAAPPQFIDMLGRYIFEPTGAISVLRNGILRDFRLYATFVNLSAKSYGIPDDALIEQARELASRSAAEPRHIR